MNVRVSSVLRSYTKGEKSVNVEGTTLLEVLNNLDQKFPGIKFRFIDEHDNIRPHMNLFVNKEQVETLEIPVEDHDELFIVQSLSGGKPVYSSI